MRIFTPTEDEWWNELLQEAELKPNMPLNDAVRHVLKTGLLKIRLELQVKDADKE